MRIGIDCRIIYDVGANRGAGVERYVYSLVKYLLKHDSRNHYVLFFNHHVSAETIESLKKIRDFEVVLYKNWFPFVSNHVLFSFILWSQWLDRMIFPANTMPFLYVGRSILVIHDLVIYNHPEWFPNKQWFSKMLLVPSSVMKATTIVTVSQSTKNDLLDLFKFKPEKDIQVIYPGITEPKVIGEMAIDEIVTKRHLVNEYLFFTGTIEPRKNLINLFKAFEQYIEESGNETTRLIVAGARGWRYKKIFRRLHRVNENLSRRAIIYLGRVSDKERQVLTSRSKAFVFPSRYEGFGFPILEAMSCGVPVITSNNSAMAEYIQDEALLVDADNVEDIKLAIKKILSNTELRQELIEKGDRLWKKFNWDETAQKFLDLV
jgi:glycosyltransferase involved in cell wall biosynthesis